MSTKKPVSKTGIRTATRVSTNFALKGDSLAAYCLRNDIDKGQASRALRGIDTYPAAKALKERLIKASTEPPENTEQSMTA